MADAVAIAGRGYWASAWLRLKGNRAAVASLVALILLALACLAGPFFTGHAYDRVYQDYVREPASLTVHPTADRIRPALERVASRMRMSLKEAEIGPVSVRAVFASPRAIDERNLAFIERSDLFGPAKVTERRAEGREVAVEVPIERNRFLFGTDANGRDLLTRILHAGRISLAIGLLASGVALIIGVTYGAAAGYAGGRVDMVMMRIVDIIYSLPFIFFVILLVVFFGRNFLLMFLAVGAVEWLDMARIVRGQTLSLKRQEFVQAAEALGVGAGGILKRHIIPNLIGPVVVYVTLLVPKVILLESFLSFLGLGVQEPMTSLGVLISDGAKAIQGGTYLLIFPAAVLIVMLFALNFIGDGLRDAFDPKDR
ncbi:MAG TPA: ABC transporter permease subunit [Beijerinckiaceae bacterium]|nr:ABC transporter permease subunit [Beijerinckiaceae bacterium]